MENLNNGAQSQKMYANLPISQIELEIERIQQKYPHLKKQNQVDFSNSIDLENKSFVAESIQLQKDKHQNSLRQLSKPLLQSINPKELSNQELEHIIRTGQLPPKYNNSDFLQQSPAVFPQKQLTSQIQQYSNTADLKSVTGAMQALQMQLETFRNQNEQLQIKVDCLQQKSDSQQNELKSLQQQNINLRSQCDQLVQENDFINSERSSLSNELSQIYLKIQELHCQNTMQAEQLKSVNKKNELLAQNLQQHEQDAKRYQDYVNDEKQRLTAEMQYFESRLSEETANQLQLRTDLNTANEKLANKEIQSQKYEQKIKRIEKELDQRVTAQSSYKEMQTQVEQLKEEISKKTVKYQEQIIKLQKELSVASQQDQNKQRRPYEDVMHLHNKLEQDLNEPFGLLEYPSNQIKVNNISRQQKSTTQSATAKIVKQAKPQKRQSSPIKKMSRNLHSRSTFIQLRPSQSGQEFEMARRLSTENTKKHRNNYSSIVVTKPQQPRQLSQEKQYHQFYAQDSSIGFLNNAVNDQKSNLSLNEMSQEGRTLQDKIFKAEQKLQELNSKYVDAQRLRNIDRMAVIMTDIEQCMFKIKLLKLERTEQLRQQFMQQPVY